MPYFTDLNTYLHRSSQLIQAYPSTRITTKYSLPKKAGAPATKGKNDAAAATPSDSTAVGAPTQPKRDRSALLTLKTYHPDSGICLKYKTDKAAEVGRLLTGLGRLAKGEIIELPVTATPATLSRPTGVNDPDNMDIDSGVVASEPEAKAVVAPPAATQTVGGGGKGKKKKGKK
ncbi:uncharacterized protein A1O9_11028 [Exophiala aquamarina CBS 119918]|uniref:SRP9 domain-containing protein n=1 Tax=Exophiala aquamarina CBS 119918 TaxID=1182545 RepID=A0A072PC02_9EURO|nr:uncharacterized protein A1O9_11028 [Exophiala aquamarina CBS 119918]KEF53120.1 hypothetical protein A1O9_11028 [Exophiala aquamarina CBS 119918]